jgi:heat shock protein HtpX
MANRAKTALLLGLLTGLLLIIGQMAGGRTGLTIALIFAGLMNFFSYWFSDKIVLAMYRAKELSPDEAPRLYAIMEALTRQAGLPMPKLYLIPSPAPNAFATGRNPNHSAVAVTQGILQILDDNELAGVLAHELSHIKDRDILVGTIAATIAGAIIWLANMLKWAAIFGGARGDDDDNSSALALIFTAILAPIAAMLIQLAISRSREFLADSEAAKLSGNPLGLASALEKLSYASQRIPMEASQATAHMFIVNPLTGRRTAGFLLKLFSTHPPIEERIARLRSMRF